MELSERCLLTGVSFVLLFLWMVEVKGLRVFVLVRHC